MMKKILSLFILFCFCFLFSCSDNSTIKVAENKTEVSKEIIQNDKSKAKVDTIITKRFLKLVQFIDSSRFYFDTLRTSRAYSIPSKEFRLNIQNFIFYDCKEYTLNWFKQRASDTSYLDEWELNFNLFKNTDRITSYYFTKELIGKDDKMFLDCWVEEWKFPDENSTKIAATELGRKSDIAFPQIGAYVCFGNNYMYVFTSRTSYYPYLLGPIFKKFVSDNGLTIVDYRTPSAVVGRLTNNPN